jgi:hypothetical protein
VQPLTQAAVARCLAGQVADLVREQGVVQAAHILSIDRSTAGRWRDEPDAELMTVQALSGVIVTQVRDSGICTAISAVTALIDGAQAERGEDADAICLRALVELGEALAEDGRALADVHISLVEARRLLPLMRRARELAARAELILQDKLTRGLA